MTRITRLLFASVFAAGLLGAGPAAAQEKNACLTCHRGLPDAMLSAPAT
jgi:hypothetical protein